MNGHGSRWYENATVYAVDVEVFQDSDGDGVGDFQGLIERLDYLDRLGVDCLWLLPFYPSPNKDNGYDVADYYGVDPRHGTLGDFVEFVREAEERGIHVLIDLVVNHTSDSTPGSSGPERTLIRSTATTTCGRLTRRRQTRREGRCSRERSTATASGRTTAKRARTTTIGSTPFSRT